MSKYFTVDEMRCHDGTPYPTGWEDRLFALFETLDAIRGAWGGPLTVVSGYRTPEHNAKLAAQSDGVAKASQHVQGRAADIRPGQPTVFRVAQLHDLTKELYSQGKLESLGGLGIYAGLWIHVDIRARPSGRLVEWVGNGVGSEK
jgi:uncharacterized protein YcbK (DUF882 family)